MKYEEWAQNWLQYKIKPTTKQWTYERYKILMRRHILPKLGASELEDLTAFELQKFTVGLTERGLSANTVNGILSVLKNSLRSAVVFGVADKQYSDHIVRPRIVEKKGYVFQ